MFNKGNVIQPELNNKEKLRRKMFPDKNYFFFFMAMISNTFPMAE